MTTPATIRLPSYRGVFYPAEPALLQQQLDYLLAINSTTNTAINTHHSNSQIKAIVVPHAAYDYSGRSAGQAYTLLHTHYKKQNVKRIIILAPNHQNTANGALICSHQHWTTPRGTTVIDQAFINEHWQDSPCIHVDDATHQTEYSIEVQLPFLQHLMPEVPVVPVLVGDVQSAQLLEILRPAWHDPETLLLISSDLYHYLPRETALSAGMQIARLIENNDDKNIGPEQACAYLALRAVMNLARQEAYFWRTLAVQHSAQDNRFNTSTVVGYGAFLLLKKND